MRWVMAGLLGLMLTGCDAAADSDRPETSHRIDPATGETVITIPAEGATATLRAGPAVPVALPAGFTLFPGTRITNNARFDRAEGQGSLITFAADAPAEAIIAHYRQQAEAAGFAITLEHDAAGSLLLIGERTRDGARLAVTATGGAEEWSTTTGQLVLSAIPKD